MIRKFFEFYFKCYYRLFLNLEQVNIGLYKEKFFKPLGDKFVFKMLSKEDMKYFEKMKIKESYRYILKDRFDNGDYHQCFGIIDIEKDQLAYYCWTNSLKKYYHNEFESYFRHNGDTILFENDLALPEYRKMGFHSYCMLQRILYAKQAGFKKAIINIYFRNKPALKTAMNFGFSKMFRFPVSFRKGAVKYTIDKLTNRSIAL